MKRFEVFLVNLDPVIGSEMQKSRPCIIVSPDELNDHLKTVIIVPLTTGRSYSFRPATTFQDIPGVAAVDQIRTVSKQRLVKKLGSVSEMEGTQILSLLQEMFGFT